MKNKCFYLINVIQKLENLIMNKQNNWSRGEMDITHVFGLWIILKTTEYKEK